MLRSGVTFTSETLTMKVSLLSEDCLRKSSAKSSCMIWATFRCLLLSFMAQIYYFCFNYLGVSFCGAACGRATKGAVCVQSLFPGRRRSRRPGKELQQCTPPSRRLDIKRNLQ